MYIVIKLRYSTIVIGIIVVVVDRKNQDADKADTKAIDVTDLEMFLLVYKRYLEKLTDCLVERYCCVHVDVTYTYECMLYLCDLFLVLSLHPL